MNDTASHKNRTSKSFLFKLFLFTLVLTFTSACAPANTKTPITTTIPNNPTNEASMDIFKKPLVTNMYTADPSAHVFDGKLYIYPSHDLDHDNPLIDNEGSQFDMEDYHVFSMDSMHTLPVDLGEVLNVKTCRGQPNKCGRQMPPSKMAHTIFSSLPKIRKTNSASVQQRANRLPVRSRQNLITSRAASVLIHASLSMVTGKRI